ncbi:MAG: ACT domain-containing protein [Chthoniobacteraceae bacterium]
MKLLHVLAPNQPGILARIAEALAAAGVNIEDFDVESHNAEGIISLSVDKYDEALHVLRDLGYRAITQDTLVIRLEDKPGALAKIAVRLKDAGLDLRSMHIVRRAGEFSIVSLVASDNAAAAAVLRDVLIGEPPE